MANDPFSAMRQSIIDGAPDTAARLAQEAIASGGVPIDAINNGFAELVDLARAGIPAEIVSMPLAGATAPVTLAGSVVQHAIAGMIS